MLSALQRWMIFPGAATQGRAEAVVRAGDGVEIVELRSAANEKIAALFSAVSASSPTLLWFYGNAMCVAACMPLVERFRALGMNVLVPDFLGYGMSEGRAGEAGIYQTAEAAYAHLHRRCDIDTSRIFVGGWSLGAAAAIEIASAHLVAGLMIFSAFTNLRTLAKRLAPWAPSALLEHRFENDQKIKRVTCPILIVHGKHDSAVVLSMESTTASSRIQCRWI